jgi:hypothetical protein
MTVKATIKAEVSAQIDRAEGEAKKQAKASVEHLIDSTPTSKQAADTFNQYAKYAPKRIPDVTNTSDCVDWGKEALTNYAKSEGMKLADSEIKELASAYGLEGFVPEDLPTNKQEAYVALTQIAGAGMAYALGVDPRICTVTVDAIKDGKLGRGDVEAIGATAGAIGGAAVCQAFGIPAPIGAFFGGKFGAMVGNTVNDVFSIGKTQEELWIEHTKKVMAELKKTAAQANDQCSQMRHMYWDAYDKTILSLEQKWEAIELRMGWRFGLRWFDQQWDGSPFASTWDPTAKIYRPVNVYDPKIHGARQITWAQQSGSCLSQTIVSDAGSLHVKKCRYICPKPFGCPYPPPTSTTAPTSSSIFGNANRVVAAYQARGWPWKPPSARNYNCGFRAPEGAVTDAEYRNFWIEAINQSFALEQSKMVGLSQMTVRVAGDLAMTAAIVGMQKAVYDGKITAAKEATQKTMDDSQRKARAARAAANVINNGALVGGAGLLAYVWML